MRFDPKQARLPRREDLMLGHTTTKACQRHHPRLPRNIYSSPKLGAIRGSLWSLSTAKLLCMLESSRQAPPLHHFPSLRVIRCPRPSNGYLSYCSLEVVRSNGMRACTAPPFSKTEITPSAVSALQQDLCFSWA